MPLHFFLFDFFLGGKWDGDEMRMERKRRRRRGGSPSPHLRRYRSPRPGEVLWGGRES